MLSVFDVVVVGSYVCVWLLVSLFIVVGCSCLLFLVVDDWLVLLSCVALGRCALLFVVAGCCS